MELYTYHTYHTSINTIGPNAKAVTVKDAHLAIIVDKANLDPGSQGIHYFYSNL